MTDVKLYMLLLGCKPPGRHTEQHDVLFAIGESLSALVPSIKKFWPEAKGTIHVDAWREVTRVDGYKIEIVPRSQLSNDNEPRLFFINLGGYVRGVFDEQHYRVLTVQADKAKAIQQSKTTAFFRNAGFKGATSHVDDKYGIDVDDLYEIEEVLAESQKEQFRLAIAASADDHADELHLGYFKLSAL